MLGIFDHSRIFVKDRFTKVFTLYYARSLSRLIHAHYGWCCVYDEMRVGISVINKIPGITGLVK